ncbi:hypothetical protein NUU61_003021, partial [Penicillium alfredii]
EKVPGWPLDKRHSLCNSWAPIDPRCTRPIPDDGSQPHFSYNRNNYKGNWITDDSPSSEIGESDLYSLQNGLNLDKTVHSYFDDFKIGIDSDTDTAKLGGKCLKDSARHGTNSRNRVCTHLLRWRLRMCVYRNLKANVDIQAVWEDDLGSDDIGQILEQPDAGHRMEVKLFTRLGEQVA